MRNYLSPPVVVSNYQKFYDQEIVRDPTQSILFRDVKIRFAHWFQANFPEIKLESTSEMKEAFESIMGKLDEEEGFKGYTWKEEEINYSHMIVYNREQLPDRTKEQTYKDALLKSLDRERKE